MSYCLIFPGQGSQFVGMSRGLGLEAAVGGHLCALMENGPEEELGQNVNAQPSVLSVSAALWERSGLKQPAAVMGHSLGEYTALVATGCLDQKDALGLVRERAGFMDASMPDGSGGMAAVIGLTRAQIEEVIAPFSDLWVANLNGAFQVVVSGAIRSIEASTPLLKEGGARRVVLLKVSVASHCPFMGKARMALRRYLETIGLKKPSCPVISNVSARPETEPERIKGLLADQLINPVRFEESVLAASRLGIDLFVEIGPRSVLAPLVKRIVPGVKVEVITSDGH